jgi:hypothetical protein
MRINALYGSFVLLGLGLILSYNPVYMHYLLENGALGTIRIRFISFLLAATFLILNFFTVQSINPGKIYYKDLIAPFLLLCFFIFSSVFGFFSGNSFLWILMDSFPLIEFFLVYFCFYFMVFEQSGIIFKRIVVFLCAFLFFISITDLISYSYLSFVKNVSFGALRALIGDVTVNRLLDFVIPLFVPAFLYHSFVSKSKFIKVVSFFLSLVALLSFFRTVYLAVIIGLIYFALLPRQKTEKRGRLVWLLVSGGGLGVVLFLVQVDGISLGSLFIDRFVSIFDSSLSHSGRIHHNVAMLQSVLVNPLFGVGLGGQYALSPGVSTPVSVSSNYFLQLIVIMGLPGGLLFIGYYLSVFIRATKLGLRLDGCWEKIFFHSCGSVLLVMAVLLLLFPYTQQFPLMYIFAFIASIVDRYHNVDSNNLCV